MQNHRSMDAYLRSNDFQIISACMQNLRSPDHLLCHFSLPGEGPLPECSRNEVPLTLPVPAATLQEPPLPFPPAEHVPRSPGPDGSAAVPGHSTPCANSDRA